MIYRSCNCPPYRISNDFGVLRIHLEHFVPDCEVNSDYFDYVEDIEVELIRVIELFLVGLGC